MTRTIFLSTDGRHVTLGRGADTDMPDEIVRQVRSVGLRGFVAVMSGQYHGSRPVQLSRCSSIDAHEREWGGAVAEFNLHRVRSQGRG